MRSCVGIYEGFYNFSDICVPVHLFTPSLNKFDVGLTGKDIEDNHTMEHKHKKENYSIYRWIYSNRLILQLSLHDAKMACLRWPIKDINFILVLIVFLSLSTAEKSLFSEEKTLFRGIILFSAELYFSPRNYTFLRGIKLYSAELNFTPRNYTFHRREKSCDREPRYGCAQPNVFFLWTSLFRMTCMYTTRSSDRSSSCVLNVSSDL